MGARAVLRSIGGALGGASLLLGGLSLTATPAGAVQTADYSNPASITIPAVGSSGPASAYPSTISVPAGLGAISEVEVSLNGLNHTFAADLAVQLVSPSGSQVILLGTTGSGTDFANTNLRFDDDAAAEVAAINPMPSGSFKPSGNSPQPFNAPAPTPATSKLLSSFDGQSPTGDWKLFIDDRVGGDVGALASWTLHLTAADGPPVGSGWQFFNSSGPNDIAGPFTFSAGPTVLRITDAFCAGDQYFASDNGSALGFTNTVPTEPCPAPADTADPDLAYADPRYSHACFVLPAGAHALRFHVNAAPFGAGGAYYRVDAIPPPPGCLQVAPPGPTSAVSVSASPATAAEGGTPAQVTFTRSTLGDNQNLSVGYSTSGDAVSGNDYTPLGNVTIPAGQLSVTLPLTALDDTVVEPDRLLRFQVVPGAGYTVGAPNSADITITDPTGPPPSTDPCEDVTDPGFTDVPASNVHAENITCLAGLGLAEGGPGGLPATQYGPRQQTTRGQIASFLARLLEAGGATLPAAPADAFDDDDDSVHELRINQLVDVGVIDGNGEAGGSYRPSDDITREEMASLVFNTINELAKDALASDVDAFTDDESSPYEDAINALASEGIVEGTGGGLYDPDGTVQRDSMASFLARSIQYLAELGDFGAPPAP